MFPASVYRRSIPTPVVVLVITHLFQHNLSEKVFESVVGILRSGIGAFKLRCKTHHAANKVCLLDVTQDSMDDSGNCCSPMLVPVYFGLINVEDGAIT